jgi:cytosine/adenosine deaminase-related metal-dependent hydrolase
VADAGSPITLGTDQHAIVDMFAEAQGLEMNERLQSGQRGRFTVAEVLAALAPAGHTSLGWPEAGTLRVGSLADLVSVRLDSIRTAGSLPEQVVLVATAADVDTVVVAGRTVVSGGRHIIEDGGQPLPLRMAAAIKSAWGEP